MFERPAHHEKVILIHVHFAARPDPAFVIEELVELARAAGAQVEAVLAFRRASADPELFVGSGQAEKIAQTLAATQAGLVIFNHDPSAGQERNLERYLKARVLSRTGLILDIFAARARTHEGKLQVELAQLEHMSTRLVRGWSHLERQKGGIGLRGPGETQLELDKRMLQMRLKSIQKRLSKVRSQRATAGKARLRKPVPNIALVGYTNVGKSSLFNALTHAEEKAQDQLFATLDPKVKRLFFPGIGEVTLADTVGFIDRLPTHLVEAFKATLNEVQDADVLIHVHDLSHPQREACAQAVQRVLEEIGADDRPVIHVMNKIDCCAPEERAELPGAIYLSARTHEGLEQLHQRLAQTLSPVWMHVTCFVPMDQPQIYTALHRMQAVQEEQVWQDRAWALTVSLAQGSWEALFGASMYYQENEPWSMKGEAYGMAPT